MDIEHVRSRFIKHFDGTTGFIYASPGRINLIGEHIIPTTTVDSYSPELWTKAMLAGNQTERH